MKQLNNNNYFSQEMQLKYFGVSQFKSFESCQASALAEVTSTLKKEQTTSLLVGSYVDAYFEGAIDDFKSKHPELFTKKGELKSEYKNAENVIKRAERDKMFMHFMSGEKQVIMTGTIEGVSVKIKIDSYHANKMIVDLKVMKDFAPIYIPERGRLNWVEAWEYDLQGAIYQEIVRQNTGKLLPFYIAGITKEKEPDLAIIEVAQSYLDVCLDDVKSKIMLFDAIKKGLIEPERCEHCNYCKSTKVLEKVVNLEELNFE
ncbi:MAG: PD-(D/E)XK nuclease-like domain-containing protein [Acutalibacteraceae bacterium]